ncbi:hypothetical protein E2493_00650 [Sphingomonas parva]|uniref:Uncharacterized protein n=1 Tax=Sphingomonas parva TaxID=2555898 RepID=A0A4Y8ZZJ3_9SPHN|nr:putative 2OG-Fe(II) oxygenase [Sphingomonas parva]TFI60256.1 hypothetical protein E2493_00650 [Sphingomonas parva]
MTYLAEVERTRAQSAVLELLAGAAAAAPDDLTAARRFAQACMRSNNRQRAPGAWRNVVAAAPDDATAWAAFATSLLEIGDVDGAVAAGEQALALAPDDAAVHAALGFALRTRGEQERADAVFERGFALDPTSPYLTRGVGQALIRRGDGAALARHCEAALERMAPSGWLFAQYTIALALLGRRRTLATLLDYDRLLRRVHPEAPEGFDSLDSFHAALRAEQESLGAVPSRIAAADVVHGAFRLPGGLQGAIAARGEAGAPASAALLRTFDAQQADYEQWLAASGEILQRRSKPSGTWLHSETVITPRQGYVAPHTHACTWLSGVYYVDVPKGMVGKEGCVEFAPPGRKLPSGSDIWPVLTLKPEPGLLLLFPGYFYHHVHATNAPGDRVVVTFDVKPTRESRPRDLDPALLRAAGLTDQE